MKKIIITSLFLVLLSGCAFAHPTVKVHNPHYECEEYYVIGYSPYYYVYYDYDHHYHSSYHYGHKHHYKKKYVKKHYPKKTVQKKKKKYSHHH